MVRRDGLALVCLFRADFFGYLSSSLLSLLGLLDGIVSSSALAWWGPSATTTLAGWNGGVSRVGGVLGSLGGIVGVLGAVP